MRMDLLTVKRGMAGGRDFGQLEREFAGREAAVQRVDSIASRVLCGFQSGQPRFDRRQPPNPQPQFHVIASFANQWRSIAW